MRHFAHYVRREIVVVDDKDKSWAWFAENQPDFQGFESPSYHMTRSTSGPATRVGKGDVIWLFSQLYSPWGRFPPSLDAKICVGAISAKPTSNSQSKEVHRIRYEAEPESKWFPLFDATTLINQLRTVDGKGNSRPLLSHSERPIGQALQSMRELFTSRPLIEWEDRLDKTPPDFISYRIIDGTRLAYEKATQLVEAGKPVFWDRWSLPRRLAERREFLSDEALDTHLYRIMDQCHTVWGILTPKYGESGSYSAREMEKAKRLQKLRFYPR